MIMALHWTGYAQCEICKERLHVEDQRRENINFYLRNLGWERYQSEGRWEVICPKCSKVTTGIDPDDEYDNLKDNELSLASNDSQ